MLDILAADDGVVALGVKGMVVVMAIIVIVMLVMLPSDGSSGGRHEHGIHHIT